MNHALSNCIGDWEEFAETIINIKHFSCNACKIFVDIQISNSKEEREKWKNEKRDKKI